MTTDPNTDGTVYIGTAQGGLWRSLDCGATWSKINTGRSAATLDSGGLYFVKPDRSAPDTIFAAGLYASDPSLHRSTNGGKDWDSVFPAGSNVANQVSYNFFQDAGIDITNPKHIVASFHADCKGDTGPMCLGESNDGGLTWRLFKGPTSAWGERAGVFVFDATSFMYHTWADGAFYTHDSGVTWERVADGSNFQMYRAKDGLLYVGSPFALLRSPDGRTWTKVEGGAPVDAFVGDGNRMFGAWDDNSPKFGYAMEDNPSVWTTWPTPAKLQHRVTSFGYDNSHHVLYSSNTTDGVWRVVTR